MTEANIMNIIQITPKLFLIPLDQKLPGFAPFIGAWLYKGEKNILVDAGPGATAPDLLKALDILDVPHPDAILLTHIHIDHAGGAGHIAQQFPDTPVVCHESGILHLADPSRLWEGSLKTLGQTARAYGPFQPVPSGQLYDAAMFREYNIEPFLTPGHAPHHVSFLIDSCLFVGEAGGIFLEPGQKSETRNDWYLRPATPPRFFLETSIQSIDTLKDVPHDILCYGHFGATRNTPRILETHKQQIFNWADIIREQMKAGHGTDLIDICTEALLNKDPLLACWNRMEPAVRERERGFMHNSIRGFTGYIESEIEESDA